MDENESGFCEAKYQQVDTTVRVICGDARRMTLISDNAVDLVVTSPPYWQIKDYGTTAQIGYGQSLHEYLHDLTHVWAECARVLKPGRRLCINIGDQFARASVYGRYKVIPLHAEVIAQAASVGLDYLGAIIWQKKTTMQTSGGAVIMGSFPYPPNGIVELDYEYILLFKKPGDPPRPTSEQKRASVLTKEEWKQFFAGHWTFGGVRQGGHEAMFPDELPRRLIRMFSFAGEMVLDPFLGSGTTAKVAAEWGREAIGYEINREFLPLIREKVGLWPLTVEEQTTVDLSASPQTTYTPHIPDARPLCDPETAKPTTENTYKVADIVAPDAIRLTTGLTVRLLGIHVGPDNSANALSYLQRYVKGKSVILRFATEENSGAAYVQLANKLFINRKMIEMGLACADRSKPHRYLKKFITAEELGKANNNL